MDWEKSIHNTISTHSGYDPDVLEDFISTEIIEKLIEDIPNHLEYYREIATTNKLKNDWDMTQLKQQLRNKWL